jgi:hypothetical protein
VIEQFQKGGGERRTRRAGTADPGKVLPAQLSEARSTGGRPGGHDLAPALRLGQVMKEVMKRLGPGRRQLVNEMFVLK